MSGDPKQKKDFLSIRAVPREEFRKLLDLSALVKAHPERYRTALEGKVLALIFEKPSLRTRVTFEVGVAQMGGRTIYLAPQDIQLGKRESVHDVAKNLERWLDGIVVRTFAHSIAEELARFSRVPVINALTDLLHPCQAVAAMLTLEEKKGALAGLKLAFVGDGNNVAHSLMNASAKLGVHFAIAHPEGHAPDRAVLESARADAVHSGSRIELFRDPREAVRNADAVYTDVWASMGQESEAQRRREIFRPYQVNAALMSEARPDALFMHCLPAHRGEEVTDDVIDSPRSVVFDEAENRLHTQKAILLDLFGIA